MEGACEDNLLRQQEEIEALNSIYEEFIVLDSERSLTITVDCATGQNAQLSVSLPPDYPSSAPPTYSLFAPFLTTVEKQKISLDFDQQYLDNLGESVIFLWVECLREFLQNRTSLETSSNDDAENDAMISEEIQLIEALKESRITTQCPEIVTGDTIEDRRSVFQGHTAVVKSLDEVKLVIDKLYENKKIAQAAHNIYAYRIFHKEKNTWLSDCEDDGEDAAGGRLLHLLEILDVVDRLVVVTRWYGGILLGPDRFKHINNAARSVIQQVIPIVKDDTKSKKKKGK